jgi:hypothetical protein
MLKVRRMKGTLKIGVPDTPNTILHFYSHTFCHLEQAQATSQLTPQCIKLLHTKIDSFSDIKRTFMWFLGKQGMFGT